MTTQRTLETPPHPPPQNITPPPTPHTTYHHHTTPPHTPTTKKTPGKTCKGRDQTELASGPIPDFASASPFPQDDQWKPRRSRGRWPCLGDGGDHPLAAAQVSTTASTVPDQASLVACPCRQGDGPVFFAATQHRRRAFRVVMATVPPVFWIGACPWTAVGLSVCRDWGPVWPATTTTLPRCGLTCWLPRARLASTPGRELIAALRKR